MWAAIALSFGLAMDASAVSIARGLAGHHRRELVILPLVFGGFQAAMSALGWLGGRALGPYIASWQHYVAFGLLAVIGIKMIVDAWRADDDVPGAGTLAIYLGLGLATSIDAAAAGLTLPLLPIAPSFAVALIGGITAACAAIAYVAGRALGKRLGTKLGAIGGVVLIAIGIEMLIRGA